jgi:GNAT superfamily N-acetyltransferase
MNVTVRPVTAEDRAAWDRLYAGYGDFYNVPQDDVMRSRVFGWLMDPQHEVSGLVAEDVDGALIGLTHFRPYSSPLRAITNCFLDDLFVSPDARGSGAAQALIGEVRRLAQERGWGVVRWITAEDNYRARAVYDKLANRTKWVTYDLTP